MIPLHARWSDITSYGVAFKQQSKKRTISDGEEKTFPHIFIGILERFL